MFVVNSASASCNVMRAVCPTLSPTPTASLSLSPGSTPSWTPTTTTSATPSPSPAPSNDPAMDGPSCTISLLAGTPGSAGTADGQGASSIFANPYGIAYSPAGLYVSAPSSNNVRFVTFAGAVSTIAGSPVQASIPFSDGQGTAATFNFNFGVSVVPGPTNVLGAGNIVVADGNNHRLRLVTPTGLVTTLAGSGVSGFSDGLSSAAQFNQPYGVDVDAAGAVWVADSGNRRIRVVTSGVVTTVVGSTNGFSDGQGSNALFGTINDVVADATTVGTQRVYVTDTGERGIWCFLFTRRLISGTMPAVPTKGLFFCFFCVNPFVTHVGAIVPHPPPSC